MSWLVYLRQQFQQIVPLYKDTIPPKLFGKLLSLKRSFEAFDLMFGLFADLLVNEPEKWPKNDLGVANNVRLRNSHLKTIEKNIVDVLEKVESLFKELDEWEI